MMHPPRSIPVDPWDAARVWRWYKRRLVKGGAWVACDLTIMGDRDAVTGELLSDERLIACIDGNETDASNGNVPGWPWTAIPEAEHRFLIEDATWCRNHAPHLPAANPTRRLTLADAPLPF